MLSRRITESDKITALRGNDRARFVYVALLPYTDKAGRVNVNPEGLKGTIFEAFEWTSEEIEGALRALEAVGLITLYSSERHKLLAEYVNFERFNTPHKNEPDSELPGPEDESVTASGPSGNFTGNLREVGAGSSSPTPTLIQSPTPTPTPKKEEGENETRETETSSDTSTAPPTSDHLDGLEAFEARMRTGTDPGKREQLVRERVRLHIGARETNRLAEHIPRWAREHDPPAIDRLWEASHPDKWRGTPRAGKPRVWNFADLLDQRINPPCAPGGDATPRDDLQDGDRVLINGREHTARMVTRGWVVLDNDTRVPRSSVTRLRTQSVTA